jgi:hypothetical protein
MFFVIRHFLKRTTLLLVAATFSAPAVVRAQTTTSSIPTDLKPETASTALSNSKAVPHSNPFLNRIKFVSVDSITHFRYMDTAPGKVTARDEFYKLSTRIQINLIGDGAW